MRLLKAEFARFWSRRLVWIVAALAMAAIVTGVAIAYAQTSATGPDAELIEAETARERADCIRSLSVDSQFLDSELAGVPENQRADIIENEYCNFSTYVDDSRFYATTILWDDWDREADPRPWAERRPDTSEPSSRSPGVGIGSDQTTQELRYPNDGLTGVVPGVAIFFLVVAVVIGASFMGAEYRFGTVENLLLWEPRRWKVLGAKYTVGFISAFALSVFLLSFLVGGLLLLAGVHGVYDGLDTRFWIDLVSTLARGGLVGGLFFILAMAVSVIARNTTAAVGVILGWFAISNILIEAFLKGLRPYELFANAIAFISEGDVGRYQYLPRDGYHELLYSHSYMTAGFVTAGWTLGFAAFSWLMFVRRDVD